MDADRKSQIWNGKRAAAFAGQMMQSDYPQIASEYVQGATVKELIRRYDLAEAYGISENTANLAVRLALGGYDSERGIAGFGGMLDPQTLERVAAEHRSKNGIVRGNFNKENGVGFLDWSYERRRDLGKNSSLVAHLTPWSHEEVHHAYSLSIHPEYRSGDAADAKKISTELNRIFHQGRNVRKSRAVSNKLCKERKRRKE